MGYAVQTEKMPETALKTLTKALTLDAQKGNFYGDIRSALAAVMREAGQGRVGGLTIGHNSPSQIRSF